MPLVGITKTVAIAGTAEAMSSSKIAIKKIALMAKKVGGDNTGNVFLGVSDLDQGVKEYIELAPGDYWEFGQDSGVTFRLDELYVDADTNGDGVVGLYVPA